MQYVMGLDFLRAVAKALNLEDRPIQQIIIHARANDAVRVYIQELVDEGPAMDAIVEALAKVANKEREGSGEGCVITSSVRNKQFVTRQQIPQEDSGDDCGSTQEKVSSNGG